MFSQTQKTFRNNATMPLVIGVSANVAADGRVLNIFATGGTLCLGEGMRAERERMFKWVRKTFVGQSEAFLSAHNGVVPDGMRAFVPPVVNIQNVMRPPGEHVAAASEFEHRVYTGYPYIPEPGTHWQDRLRPTRHFVVTEYREEPSGRKTVRMERIDRSGVYEFPFDGLDDWNNQFKRVPPHKAPPRGCEAPSGCNAFGLPPTAPFASSEIPYSSSRIALRYELEAYQRRFFRSLGAVSFKHGRPIPAALSEALNERRFAVVGNKKPGPPRAGERYRSHISRKDYRVIAATRKALSTDYDILMEREPDGHRTKYTYRDHAKWLTCWLPLHDEYNNAAKAFGEAMHSTVETTYRPDLPETNAEAALVFNQGHTLNRIVRELDKRVPGWQKQSNTGPQVTFADRMVRAIRTLRRMSTSYAERDRELATTVANLSDKNRELSATLGARTREVDALRKERGGSWGPERIRTEQDRMREMIYEYTRLFRLIHGTERTKAHMQAFGVSTMRDLPLEQYLSFMRDCRTYAEKCMP